MSFCRAGDDAEGVEMNHASVSTLSGLRKLVRLYLMCHPVEAGGVQTGVGDVEASASAGQFDDGRREVFSFYVSFGADIEDDIDTLADALHIKIQDGRLSGLDVYVLLHRIEYGRLYFLQVFIVRIEIGQVIALYDVGLFIAHTADLQIKVFHAYLIVVDVIVQIFYADDGSRGLLRIACLCRNIRILLVDDKNVVLTSAQVKRRSGFFRTLY